jgi:lipopolysaccharide export system protein LptA
MKKVLFVALAVLVTASFTSAQMPTVKGFLVDNMCQMKMKTDQGALAKHSRDCALMDSCIKSGYAVVTADGMVYTLDAKGNEQAVAALKASKQTDNLKVTISGSTKNGMVMVSSLMLDK